jgi:isopenicillin N synthase-like dioxygenase
VNGKLQLSQGITRDLSRSGIGGQFTEIPVIDLEPMTNPSSSPEDKAKLVADIRAPCSRVGFFVIKDHGIEWKIVDDAFDGLKEFFDLPMEKKMEVHQSMSDSYQGYEQPYYTNVDRLKKGGELSLTRIYHLGGF